MGADAARPAAGIIELLDLAPHPEGGHYRETFRDRPGADGRSISTAIYYLLQAGEHSAWHRIDAVEIWHHLDGGPLDLTICVDGKHTISHRLGTALAAGERPQLIVPARAWQTARPLGAFTLASCTVAPGFVFDRFELAPSGWEPG